MYTHTRKDLSTEDIEQAVTIFRLVSDPTRLKILWALVHGEHAVGELAEHVQAQPAAVSQHLAKLRIARIVKVRREGNKIFYSVENEHVQKLIQEAVSHAEHITRGDAQ